MSLQDLRLVAITLAWKMWGQPYVWGGDDPMRGFDCSGMAVEILQSVGIIPINEDYTAQLLWNKFIDREVYDPQPGCLVFWENSQGHVIHVEMYIGNGLSMGASGGGSRIKTQEDAVRHNAFIKVRPVLGRGLIRGYLDPFKPGGVS